MGLKVRGSGKFGPPVFSCNTCKTVRPLLTPTSLQNGNYNEIDN